MMLLDLVCFDCLMEQVNKGVPTSNGGEPIQTPYEEVNNSGIYTVNCGKGHTSKAVIENINFEILFEYGLNAIVDGYYREAVSSLTASMERYFEFFIKVVLRASKMDFATIDKVWKSVSNQSERQLGAYIFLYSQTFGEEPLLLNANKDVPVRNGVIHKGNISSKKEAIDFGNTLLTLIETSLIKLKNKFPETTVETFNYYSYPRTAKESLTKIEKESGEEQNYVVVNIMTTIDVMHGRELTSKDGRAGGVEERIKSILDGRVPKKLTLFND